VTDMRRRGLLSHHGEEGKDLLLLREGVSAGESLSTSEKGRETSPILSLRRGGEPRTARHKKTCFPLRGKEKKEGEILSRRGTSSPR